MNLFDVLREPTGDECESNAVVWECDTRVAYAIWYPQMGGYVGKAIAVCDKGWREEDSAVCFAGCVEVFVWHDGEFPFAGEGEEGRKPIELHHCDPWQFARFGETLGKLNDALCSATTSEEQGGPA